MAKIDKPSRSVSGDVEVWKSFPTLRSLGVAAQYFERYVNKNTRQRSVDVVLLTCLVQGKGVHVMGRQRLNIEPGYVGITHYGQKHVLLTDSQGIEVINLYLDLQNHALPVLPRSLQSTLSNILSPHPGLVNQLNRRVSLNLPVVSRMCQPLEQILRETKDRQPGYESVVRQAMVLFLIECSRVAMDTNWRSEITHDEQTPLWLDDIRQLIDERFDEPLSLDDMVKVAGVSREHVCRRFKTYAGRTPMAYLNDRRIQAAMWQLRTTNEPIVQVAVSCGFEDVSHFSRKFKSMVGTTPGRYRKTIPG